MKTLKRFRFKISQSLKNNFRTLIQSLETGEILILFMIENTYKN